MPRQQFYNLFGPDSQPARGQVSHWNSDEGWGWSGNSRRFGDRAKMSSGETAVGTFGEARLWWAIVAFGLLILIARILFLQTAMNQSLVTIAEGNRIRIQTIKAPRGLFYDRNGVVLTKNEPTFAFGIIPVDLPVAPEARASLFEYAAAVVGTTTEAISQQVAKEPGYSYRPVIVGENINHEQAITIAVKAAQYPGLHLINQTRRTYLKTATTTSLSHVLGYLGKLGGDQLESHLALGYDYDDVIGKSGLELFYEEILKGRNGKQQVEVDARGEPKEILANEKATPGAHLSLTIDSELQGIAEDRLRAALTQYGKKRGAVVIEDPRTGEILSLVSLPAYDANIFNSRISQEVFGQVISNEDRPLFSRAISGEYPSGSTFKIIMASAALDENIVTPETGFMSTGGISVGRWFFPDWRAGGHGWTTITKAIADSVNTFFYYVGGGYNDFVGLGPERIGAYAEKFYVGKQLQVDLPGEATGLMPNPTWKKETKNEQWYIGDTYNISIGQGDILVTPLQVAAWTSIIANGGTLYQPHIVKGIIDPVTDEVTPLLPRAITAQVVSPEAVKVVAQGLREGVTDGSSARLSLLKTPAAGKTGTAQWSRDKAPHAWATAYAPFDDPKIVVTVLVEEGEEGSRVAIPVAYEILKWWEENR